MFLPSTRADLEARGWERLDFVCITGDAYVDHPSFGIAVISRLLEDAGHRVGVIAQPDWKDTTDFKRLGRPRLAFLVSGGNIDSMVANYTVAGKPRREDAYSPGGRGGRRPDRAAIVYAVRAREACKGIPIILGGLEASLRRLSHYDYWSDKVRRSILVDAKADLLVYGMGERAILEIARRLEAGEPIEEIRDVPGTVYPVRAGAETPAGAIELPSHERMAAERSAFAAGFKIQHLNTDPFRARPLVEPYEDGRRVVQNPPAQILSGEQLDHVYELPYMRAAHPSYDAEGGVPAIQEIRFSLTSSRGCFGSCSFCALTFHQGRIVSSRSHASILREAALLTADPAFKGHIHDLGGPTANFRFPACDAQERRGACSDRQCLHPRPCPALRVDHGDYLEILEKLRTLPGVKKVFIRSGLRYDYLLADAHAERIMGEICAHHVSGQLKVAPEHVSPRVLELMGKPSRLVYERFRKLFAAENRRLGKKQYLVPYFISSHPGSDLAAAVELAEYLRDQGLNPEQVQDFYPTPGTLATCMYHTGCDPMSGRPVHVPKTKREKAMQRALLQFRDPRNHELVRAALIAAGRPELIGRSERCLAPPAAGKSGQGGRLRNSSRAAKFKQ